MYTIYDERRTHLKDLLKEALEYARNNILDSNIPGYDEMRKDYTIDVYTAIQHAINKV